MRSSHDILNRIVEGKLDRRKKAVFEFLFGEEFAAKEKKTDCNWRTIRGTPVCIGGSGKIERGPKTMQGKRPDELPQRLPAGKGERAALPVEGRTRLVDSFRQEEWLDADVDELQTQLGMIDSEMLKLQDAEPSRERDERMKELQEASDYVAELESVALERVARSPVASEQQKRLIAGLPEGWEYRRDDNQIFDEDGNVYYLTDDERDDVRTIEEALRNAGHDPNRVALEGDLKRVGASFLDDIEPDERGSLIQEGTDKAYVRIEDEQIDDWDNIPFAVQREIEEQIAGDIELQVRNDSDFYDEIQSKAQDEFAEEFDEQEFREEMIEMQVAEGKSTEEAEAFVDEALQEEADWIVSERNDRQEKFVQDLINGSWGDEQFEREARWRAENFDEDDSLQFARDNGYLDDLDGTTSARMEELNLSQDDLATMFGLDDTFELTVKPDEDTKGIQVAWAAGGNWKNGLIDRKIYTDDDGEIVVKHEFFWAPKDAESGFGLQVFSRSVAAYRGNGFAKIKTHAAGEGPSLQQNPKAMNGFYTWAMFGFDQDVSTLSSDRVRDAIAEDWPHAATVLDIVQAEGGAEWWRRNGGGTEEMEFDLSTGSRSMRQLESYMSQRKQRREQAIGKIEQYERRKRK